MPYAGGILETNNEAQAIVETMTMFQSSPELLEMDRRAGSASEAALSLGKLLFAVLSPIIHFLSSSPLTAAVGSLLLSTLLVTLPDKDELLEKAEEGRQAEETIMEVEDWAIDMLNGQQRAALLAYDHLRQAIDRIELQDTHEEQCVPLVEAKLLQQEIQTLVVRNTQDIHERLVKYEKAERIVKRIQDVEKEVEGKDKQETYKHLAGEVDSFWSTWCPEACIIL